LKTKIIMVRLFFSILYLIYFYRSQGRRSLRILLLRSTKRFYYYDLWFCNTARCIGNLAQYVHIIIGYHTE